MTPSYREILRRKGVKSLLVSASLARLAGRMFLLTIVLFTLDRFRSPALAGWVSFAAMAPGLAVSPLAGALLDRIGAPAAIAADMAMTALLLAGLVLAAWTGVAGPALVLALVGLGSLTSPLSTAGIRTLIPLLVPAEALPRANALDSGSFALTDVLGPALGGLLIGVLGAAPTLLAIAGLYAAAALGLLPTIRAGGPVTRKRGQMLAEAWAGLRYVLRDATLRGLAAAYSCHQMSWGLLVIAVPVAVGHALAGERDAVVGWLWAASGLAGVAGALLAGKLDMLGREPKVMAVGMVVMAIAAGLPGAAGGVAVLAVALVLTGLAAGPIDVGVLTLRQRVTPPERLGRVMAVSISLNSLGFPIGAALGGVLAARDPAWAFGAAALASLAGALGIRVLVPAATEAVL